MRINFHCPYYVNFPAPEVVLWEKCGAAETVLIMASSALAQEHRVRVYTGGFKGYHNGVEWLRLGEKRVSDCDVLINWETDRDTENIEADKRVIAAPCADIYDEVGNMDYVIVNSKWQRKNIMNSTNIPFEKFYILPHGIHRELYDKVADKVKGRLVWCASPDRGFQHLLRIFPLIRQAFPEAHLKCTYDINFERMKWGMSPINEIYWDIQELLHQDGIEALGVLPKKELIDLQLSSELMIFPEDTWRPTEAFGVTYAEALASRVAVIASDVDCVGELWGDYIALMPPPPFKYQDWADLALELLNDENKRKQYHEAGREKVFQDYTWEAAGIKWREFITKLTTEEDK